MEMFMIYGITAATIVARQFCANKQKVPYPLMSFPATNSKNVASQNVAVWHCAEPLSALKGKADIESTQV